MTLSSMFYLFILLLTLDTRADAISDLVVETSTGFIKGTKTTTFTQKEARAFYCIPYAEPPLGKLRFKPPVPVAPWKGILDASSSPLPCYQTYTKESLKMGRRLETTVRRPWNEDCLTLNIWTPAITPDDAPVMILIHDGDFATGTGAYPYFDASTTAVEEEIIHFSLNYRLGAFGFLSLGVPELPGNLGLMDQQLALKWIRKNVDKFGGKPDAIFFLGLGAGAASIGHQIIQSENAGLFKTGIMLDGAPTCSSSWQSMEEAVEIAKHLSQSLGCNHSSIKDEIECLQNAHPEDILDACTLGKDSETADFKPNIDGSFIKEEPTEAMKAGRMNNVTVIVVNTPKARSLTFLNLNEDILSGPEPTLTEAGFREAVRRGKLAETELEESVIYDWYVKKNCRMNGTEIRDAAVEAYTDGISTCCTDEFLNYATQTGVLTYKCVFAFPDPKFPSWIGPHTMMGHNMLTSETVNPKYQYEPHIRVMTIAVWQMAKEYLRKKAREFQEVVPLYNLEEQPYMYWEGVPRHLKRHRTDECALWNEILPSLRNKKRFC